jgi:tRNA threonylcarbamoyladenosine biosynthesis protein TsaB
MERCGMVGILAIETSTDACSVALSIDGRSTAFHEIAPRTHNQRLFTMLKELLPGGDLRGHGIDTIAYGCGPGSFTGLRIAVSAVQGLAYSSGLPAIGVSTLAVMAQTAFREMALCTDARLLCTIDARMNEVYAAVFGFEYGMARLLEGPIVCAPAQLTFTGYDSLQLVGSGGQFLEQFSAHLQGRIHSSAIELLPTALDIIPLALEKFERGETQTPTEIQPVYVRDEVSWKKLPQQGKSR